MRWGSSRRSWPTRTPSASRRSCRSSARRTTSSSARPTRSTWRRSRRCSRACSENGYVYEGTYEGWYCPRCADFKAENEVDEGNRCPIHHIELTREQEENYFFKLSAFQEPLERLYAEREDFVAPAHALQRGALVPALGPARRAALAPQAHLGRAGAVGRGARLLRVVRRAAQLLLGALLRAARRGSDERVLAGELPRDREGHPALPRDLLAGAADGGRAGAARARSSCTAIC